PTARPCAANPTRCESNLGCAPKIDAHLAGPPAVADTCSADFCVDVYSHAMSKVAVLGASGYAGAELLRLLAGHPEFEVTYATGDSAAVSPVADTYPSLVGPYPDLVYEAIDIDQAAAHDLLFLALPHG